MIFPELREQMLKKYSKYSQDISELTRMASKSDIINPKLYEKYDVKRGLRDINGNGVLCGLTEISEIIAFGKDEDGNYVPTDLGIDNDGSIAAMHYIKDMIDNKVIPENMNSSVCQSKFMSGKAAIMLDGSWSLANFRNAGIDVGVAKLPDIQISETETGTPRVFAGGYGLAISAFTVNPEESKDFLKFATKDEYVFEYYKVTGRVPSTVGCSTDEEVLADDCLVGFYAQAEDSYPQPPINELNAVWDPLTAASVAIFTNNEDIATVMHKIKQDILANIELLG